MSYRPYDIGDITFMAKSRVVKQNSCRSNNFSRHTAITHEPRISRIPRDQEKLKKLLRLGQIPPNHAARKILIGILGLFQKI